MKIKFFWLNIVKINFLKSKLLSEETHLADTFNHAAKHNYKNTLSKSQPDNKWLFLRLVKDIDWLIKEEEFRDIVYKLKSSIDKEKNIKKTVLDIFEFIFNKFKTWFTEAQIKEAIWKFVWFDDELIIPIEKLSDLDYLLNETKWPTDAFKDLALQIVTKLVAMVVKEKNIKSIDNAIENKKIYEDGRQKDESINDWYNRNSKQKPKLTFVINRVSTTWDTAPAAWNWILWENFVLLIMWYPVYESTLGQIAQMERLWNKNDNVFSQPFIEAFSGIQEKMKEKTTEAYKSELENIIKEEFKQLIEEYGFEISVDNWTFNSINPARVDMQTAYHTVWHAQAEAKWIIEHSEELIEVVPSGNWWHMFSTLMSRYL